MRTRALTLDPPRMQLRTFMHKVHTTRRLEDDGTTRGRRAFAALSLPLTLSRSNADFAALSLSLSLDRSNAGAAVRGSRTAAVAARAAAVVGAAA